LRSQEAIDAAQIIIDIASSPGKRKAPPPDDDEEDLGAAIQKAIENDDHLSIAKEDKALTPQKDESLVKNCRDKIRTEITQEFEEREHAQEKRKTEQEDHISFPLVSIYIILRPLPTYLSGTANTHNPLRGTPPLADGTRPRYTALRTTHYLALRPSTWPYGLLPDPTVIYHYLTLRSSTITWPYGHLPLPGPTASYLYLIPGTRTCTVPIYEELPILYPLRRNYPHRTLPILEKVLRCFTEHTTLGWCITPIRYGTAPLPGYTANYPHTHTGRTYPYLTLPTLEELPIPYLTCAGGVFPYHTHTHAETTYTTILVHTRTSHSYCTHSGGINHTVRYPAGGAYPYHTHAGNTCATILMHTKTTHSYCTHTHMPYHTHTTA
jgi:hypothetical protein